MSRWKRTLALIAVVLGVVGLGAAIGQTSARWSDPAVVKATVSAGTWVTIPANTCQVLVSGVVSTTATCKVTSVVLGTAWGPRPVYQPYTLNVSYSNVPTGRAHSVRITQNLSTPVNAAMPMVWPGATVSNPGGATWDRSTALPVATFAMGNWWSGTGTSSLEILVTGG